MRKRELSCFLCKEMLYEFSIQTLDPNRLESVQDHLNKCDDCREQMENFNAALSYTESLSGVHTSKEHLFTLTTKRSLGSRLRRATDISNLSLPSRIFGESVIVAGIIVVVLYLIQTNYFAPDNQGTPVMLAKVEPHKDLEPAIEPAPQLAETHTSPLPPPEPISEKVPESAVTKNENKKTKANPNIGLDGSVYKIYMSSSQINKDTDSIKSEILSLGGKKAGAVELGWRKVRGSYFHFSLPSTSKARLVSFLNLNGNVHVEKEKHWRVMPKGQVRYILWLEEIKEKKVMPVAAPQTETTPNAIAGKPEAPFGETSSPSENRQPQTDTSTHTVESENTNPESSQESDELKQVPAETAKGGAQSKNDDVAQATRSNASQAENPSVDASE